MEVRHITFQPNDSRFYYEPPEGPGKVTLLEPHKDNTVIPNFHYYAKPTIGPLLPSFNLQSRRDHV